MNNAYLTIQTNYVNYDNPLYCQDKVPSVMKFLDEDEGGLPEENVEMMCKVLGIVKTILTKMNSEEIEESNYFEPQYSHRR